MAERPWVTSNEVREYTEIEAVKNRTDARLTVDITRAEMYVIKYTNNHFENCEKIPSAVKTAVILLAEAYASYAHYIKTTSGGAFKSESFDDYSYSTGDSSTIEDLIGALDLAALLDEYIIKKPSGDVIMRLRKL